MIVMAYCEGGDLSRYLRTVTGSLDEQLLVEWLVQICMALQESLSPLKINPSNRLKRHIVDSPN